MSDTEEGVVIASETSVASSTPVEITKPGKFYDALKRNPKDIKQERAALMGSMAEREYRAAVESLYYEMSDLELQRDARLDMAPDNKDVFMRPADFDAKKFVQTDILMGEKIRDLRIRFTLADDRYFTLFGKRVGGGTTY